jgi:hypothetical protein
MSFLQPMRHQTIYKIIIFFYRSTSEKLSSSLGQFFFDSLNTTINDSFTAAAKEKRLSQQVQ